MLGAIYGDIVGSRFEFQDFGSKDFVMLLPECHFTDDTLMTLAVAEALVITKDDRSNLEKVLIRTMKKIASEHPNVSWGQRFYKWLFEYEVPVPLNSYGNGSAMRISPVGWVCDTLEETIDLSFRVTNITHNHPEGIKGAEAIAVAIFMARNGSNKEEIKNKMIEYYPQIKDQTVESIKASGYCVDELGHFVTCQGSVPQAITCFLESETFEDAIRNAISLNGDADTLACMAGSIAEAYYGLTYNDEDKILEYLTDDLKSCYFAFDLIKKKRKK